jgi:hypothetical protein
MTKGLLMREIRRSVGLAVVLAFVAAGSARVVSAQPTSTNSASHEGSTGLATDKAAPQPSHTRSRPATSSSTDQPTTQQMRRRVSRSLPFRTVAKGAQAPLNKPHDQGLRIARRGSVVRLSAYSKTFSTGGYSLKVERVWIARTSSSRREFCVLAHLTEPRPGSTVTQGFTYPYHVIAIKRSLIGRSIPRAWVRFERDRTVTSSSRNASPAPCMFRSLRLGRS